MVLDLKRFTPGQELRAGLLTVTEIIPGGQEQEGGWRQGVGNVLYPNGAGDGPPDEVP